MCFQQTCYHPRHLKAILHAGFISRLHARNVKNVIFALSGFFIVRRLHPALDPSLMFVMGGALLLTTPGFQAILRGKALPHPACNSSFSCPTNNAIDKKLLLGGACTTQCKIHC